MPRSRGDAAAPADAQDTGNASAIKPADITNINCNDSVVFQEFNNPPATCTFGSTYDAGDVGIFRTCTYLSSGTLFVCSESFTESFFHSAVPSGGGCVDGGFVQQVNSGWTVRRGTRGEC
jgi:hypothetical protein